MALGARGIAEGGVYTSLGSSSWIAVTSKKPIIDLKTLPYVFAHIQEGYYTSAMSIFSGGNSFRWVRDNLCHDLFKNEDPYIDMNKLAAMIPVGSNGIMFNPSLAGGTSQDNSPNIRGSFMGLSLGSTRAEMIRSSMEGIAFSLRLALDGLKKHADIGDEMLFCGGGSKSSLWRQIFADIFNLKIVKTNIDQDAASLGAAAIAAYASGLWDNYDIIESLHKVESVECPVTANMLNTNYCWKYTWSGPTISQTSVTKCSCFIQRAFGNLFTQAASLALILHIRGSDAQTWFLSHDREVK